MGPRDQNRPDGYPIDQKFDEAASRVLKNRRLDEEKADDFLREMDRRLRAAHKKRLSSLTQTQCSKTG